MNLTVYLMPIFSMFWKSSVNILISVTGMRLVEFTTKTLKTICLLICLLIHYLLINNQNYFQMSIVLFLAFYTHKSLNVYRNYLFCALALILYGCHDKLLHILWLP